MTTRRMTEEERAEARGLLAVLPDHVGTLPVEVIWMLQRVLTHRDAAALGLLDDLRAVDGSAR
jgi:hypothetical protein